MTRVTKEMAQIRLSNVAEDKYFWCQDGKVLKSLQDLGLALSKMDEATFGYHSNQTKNDFSKWVRDVIGDQKLARDLEKSANNVQAAKSVANRIGWLQAKLSTVRMTPM